MEALAEVLVWVFYELANPWRQEVAGWLTRAEGIRKRGGDSSGGEGNVWKSRSSDRSTMLRIYWKTLRTGTL